MYMCVGWKAAAAAVAQPPEGSNDSGRHQRQLCPVQATLGWCVQMSLCLFRI